MLLSKDSVFVITNSYVMRAYEYGILGQSRMNLGGHELDIKLLGDHFYIEKCTITNGSIKVSEDAGRRYRIVKKDDGIYIYTGLIILVK